MMACEMEWAGAFGGKMHWRDARPLGLAVPNLLHQRHNSCNRECRPFGAFRFFRRFSGPSRARQPSVSGPLGLTPFLTALSALVQKVLPRKVMACGRGRGDV
jgi:hypothetical protein